MLTRRVAINSKRCLANSNFGYAYTNRIIGLVEGSDMFRLGTIALNWRMIPSGSLFFAERTFVVSISGSWTQKIIQWWLLYLFATNAIRSVALWHGSCLPRLHYACKAKHFLNEKEWSSFEWGVLSEWIVLSTGQISGYKCLVMNSKMLRISRYRS
jgi:hypothetical protein